MLSSSRLGLRHYHDLIFNNLLHRRQKKDLPQIPDVSAFDTKCHGDSVILGGRISYSLPRADFDLSLVICRWLSGLAGGIWGGGVMAGSVKEV